MITILLSILEIQSWNFAFDDGKTELSIPDDYRLQCNHLILTCPGCLHTNGSKHLLTFSQVHVQPCEAYSTPFIRSSSFWVTRWCMKLSLVLEPKFLSFWVLGFKRIIITAGFNFSEAMSSVVYYKPFPHIQNILKLIFCMIKFQMYFTGTPFCCSFDLPFPYQTYLVSLMIHPWCSIINYVLCW